MGFPLPRLIYCFLAAGLLGQVGSLTLLAQEPPLRTPPPLPPEFLNKPPPTPPPDLPDPSELIDQLRQLEDLLSMSPEKLLKLRQTVEFIEKMSGPEREAMRIRISQVTQMTDELRREINELSSLVPDVRKADLSQFWLAEREEGRAEKRRILKDLPEPGKSAKLESWVTAFVEKREIVFGKMKEALSAKRKSPPGPAD